MFLLGLGPAAAFASIGMYLPGGSLYGEHKSQFDGKSWAGMTGQQLESFYAMADNNTKRIIMGAISEPGELAGNLASIGSAGSGIGGGGDGDGDKKTEKKNVAFTTTYDISPENSLFDLTSTAGDKYSASISNSTKYGEGGKIMTNNVAYSMKGKLKSVSVNVLGFSASFDAKNIGFSYGVTLGKFYTSAGLSVNGATSSFGFFKGPNSTTLSVTARPGGVTVLGLMLFIFGPQSVPFVIPALAHEK